MDNPSPANGDSGYESKFPRVPWKERWQAGKSKRTAVPRSQHGQWQPAAGRKNPLELLEQSNVDRLPKLIPLRYGRMLASPLAFYRGAAIIMAADLEGSPDTGIHTQICGDCHAMNFGWYGSPERNLVFDVTDFDETYWGPWEWDAKRLAASLAIAANQAGADRTQQRAIVAAAAASYRQRISELSRLPALELWYARLDEQHLLSAAGSSAQSSSLQKIMKKARQRTVATLMPKLTEYHAGRLRIIEQPPLIFHEKHSSQFNRDIHHLFMGYRAALSNDRRFLLDRFHILDVAYKVVGVGSVGLRCGIALLADSDGQSMFLQLKEAGTSVIEPYFAGLSKSKHQGQRVVDGQRLMQAASDLFLGWTQDESGRPFYVRQLRDMKTSFNIESMNLAELREYGELCGWALARAHAKPGHGTEIAGYLGDDDNFDLALAKFAVQYADQNERDFEAFQAAVKAGSIKADVQLAVE